MRFYSFLSLINFKQACEYLLGKVISKIITKLPNYHELENQHNIFSQIVRYNNGNIRKENKIYTITEPELTVFLRENSSDLDVFNQIFLNNEYKAVVEFIKVNLNIPMHTIIDAGANIGLTSIYFIKHFPQTNIISIEADPSNFEVLKKNVMHYENIQVINAALWNSNTTLSINSNFRDGRSWSRSVKEINQEEEQSFTILAIDINSLFNRYEIDSIDLLKIDIEGSEAKIFSPDSDLSFLDRTKIIAMEIHDEVCNRESVYQLLKDKEFILFNFNETTLCVKKYLLI